MRLESEEKEKEKQVESLIFSLGEAFSSFLKELDIHRNSLE